MSADNGLPTAWTSSQRPGLLGGAVMVYVLDVAAADEELFESWYTHEHLPERVETPGFLRGRRYRNRDHGAPGQHLTIYEVVDADVFTSEPYLAKLDAPTDLTRRAVSAFRDPHRAVMRVELSFGATTGREVTLLRAGPEADLAAQVDAALPDLLRDAAVTGVHVAATDLGATDAKSQTAEGKGAAESAATEEWLLIVEGVSGTAGVAHRVAERCGIDAAPQTYELLVTLDHGALVRAH